MCRSFRHWSEKLGDIDLACRIWFEVISKLEQSTLNCGHEPTWHDWRAVGCHRALHPEATSWPGPQTEGPPSHAQRHPLRAEDGLYL